MMQVNTLALALVLAQTLAPGQALSLAQTLAPGQALSSYEKQNKWLKFYGGVSKQPPTNSNHSPLASAPPPPPYSQ